MNTIIFNYFFSLSSNPIIAWASLFVSNILIYVFIVAAILIPIIIHRDYIYSILTFGAAASSWIAVYILKNIFMIPRPFVTLHLTPLFFESGFSFPSSHVTLISVLTVLVWNVNRKLGIVFLMFAILIGFSRMIIGVHYPLDVIVAAGFGMLIGLGILWFYKISNKFAFLSKKL